MEAQTLITLDGMEVLQIRLMEIHLRFAAEHNASLGVRPKQVRATVAYWLERIGHKGVSPRASWKTLHETWKDTFAAVLEDETPNPTHTNEA